MKTKMKKLRWLKEWKIRKIGDISNVGEKSAKNFVSQGYAEYIEEPKTQVQKWAEEQSKIIADADRIKELEEKYPTDNWKQELDRKIVYYNKKPFKKRRIALQLQTIKENIFLINPLGTESPKESYMITTEEDLKEKKKKKVDLIKGIKEEGISFFRGFFLTEGILDLTWAEVKNKYGLDNLKNVKASDIKEIFNDLKLRQKKRQVEIDKQEKKEQIKERREEEIKEKVDTELQAKVLSLLLLKQRNPATEIIVEEIKNNNYIYTTRDDIQSEVWIYRNGIYIPQGKSYIKEYCREVLGENFTSQLCNDVILKIEADTFIEHDKFFGTNYIEEVPVENGILNIFTRELTPFNPKKVFFNKLPVKYDSEASCLIITQFFKDVLKDEEDIKVMFELYGFCLLKEYRFEKAFMFLGLGRNGKGKSLSLLKKFIGVENCASVPLSQITAASSSVCELYSKMVNMAGDLSNTDLKDTGTFKQITGRDLMSAKRKYLRDLFFVNYAKLIFACNELPKVYDFSDGFWSRWILLEFPYKFISLDEYNHLSDNDKKKHKIRDEQIIERISTPEEMSGLLNEALDGLDRLLKLKDFSYTKGTYEVKEMWVRQSDSFSAFCMDYIEESYESKVKKKELRKHFSIYCRKHKIKGASDKYIKMILEDKYGASETQDFALEKGERYYEGIRLKSSETLI